MPKSKEKSDLKITRQEFDQLDANLLDYKGRTIHQIWFDVKKTGIIPKKYLKYQKSWQRKNSNWSYYLWRDDMCYALIKYAFPHLYKRFCKYDHWVQRLDIMKYALMSRYGGIYTDMDTKCMVPFDKVLEEFTADAYFVEQNEGTGYCKINSSTIYSKPDIGFWNILLDATKEYDLDTRCVSKDTHILQSTGPAIAEKVLFQQGDNFDVQIFPASKFPPSIDNTDKNNKHKYYVIHDSDAEWVTPFGKFIVKIYRKLSTFLLILLFIVVAIIIGVVLFNKYRTK